MALSLVKKKPKLTLYCEERFIRTSSAKYKSMTPEEFINLFSNSKHITKKVLEDLKSFVNFDLENCSSTTLFGKSIDNVKMVNYQNIGDFPFCGYTAGGDWEHPLFFIVYYDENELRGYVPTCGNIFYLPEKAAFGSTDAEREQIVSYIKKEFPQYSEEEIKLGVNSYLYYFDFTWIKKDIIAHFQIRLEDN